MQAERVTVGRSRCCAPHVDADGVGGAESRGPQLAGANVLIVEDDFIVAFDTRMLIEEEGATVVGPAANVAEAEVAIANATAKIDMAVLDVNLRGEYVFPIAAALRRVGVPFVFVTAYADDERLFPNDLKNAPRLAKPVLPQVLVNQLRSLLR